ncbi:MAG: type III-D CRISPR-associated protein Csx19 [bacterium]
MAEPCALQANGLELIKLKSVAQPLGEIDYDKLFSLTSENFGEQAYVVAWLDYKVLIGLWQNQDFHFHESKTFDLKYVQRLRIFDKQKELLVWRTNGGWQGRLRSDGQGEKFEDVVVAHQLLFGTKGKRWDPLYAEIKEDRGTKLVLPLADISFDRDGKLDDRVFIKTHNYVKTNSVHQATYFDCRFVAFTDDSQNELS